MKYVITDGRGTSLAAMADRTAMRRAAKARVLAGERIMIFLATDAGETQAYSSADMEAVNKAVRRARAKATPAPAPAMPPAAPQTTQEPDSRPGYYYVTVRKGEAYRRLRGPYVNDHAGALAAVDAAQRQACELDPRGHWYSYGTARCEKNEGPGILAVEHYQTGRGTLCSLDNNAGMREPTADRNAVNCPSCQTLMALNAKAAA